MSTLEEGHFAPYISFKVNGNNQVKLKLSQVSLLFRKEPQNRAAQTLILLVCSGHHIIIIFILTHLFSSHVYSH